MFGPIRHGILRSEPGVSVILQTCREAESRKRTSQRWLTLSVIQFPVQINADIVHSGDLVTIDPDQKWLHNDFSGMLKTDSGEYLRFTMKAIEQPTQGIMRILGGDPTAPDVEHGDFYGGKHFENPAGTALERSLARAYFPTKQSADTSWGIVSIWNFITGSEKYKELENSVYVGSTRLSRGSEPDSFSIAFRISQVSHVPSTTDCVEADDTIKHSEL